MSVSAGQVNLQGGRGSRTALVSRPTVSVVAQEFTLAWPIVAVRLTSMLRRRGVSHHDADEIVQETAARAFSRNVPYTDADDLFRWASVVGWRLAIDVRRRGVRISRDEVPERADTIDVAAAAEHRILLDTVKERLTELSVRDQEVLLSGLQEDPVRTRQEAVRIAVARHRARNRLRVLLDGLAGACLLWWGHRGRIWSAPIEAIAYAAMPVAACVVIAVAGWTGAAPARQQSVMQTRPAALVAAHTGPAPATPATPAPTTGPRPAGTGSTAPAPATGGAIPRTEFTIPEPGGGQGSVIVRPKEDTDHLWCLTPPPQLAQPTKCVDSPVPVGTTP